LRGCAKKPYKEFSFETSKDLGPFFADRTMIKFDEWRQREHDFISEVFSKLPADATHQFSFYEKAEH